MYRQLTKPLLDAIDDNDVHVCYLAFLDFGPNTSDALFAHDTVGDIRADLELMPPFNGTRTYTGVGALAVLEEKQEDPSDKPSEFKLALSGIDMDLLGHARNLDHIGKKAVVWLGFVNVLTGNLIDAFIFRRGRMDRLEWGSGQGTVSLEVYIEDERSLNDGGPGILYDDGQQRALNPNDGFCKSSLYETKEVVIGPGNGDDNRNIDREKRNDFPYDDGARPGR